MANEYKVTTFSLEVLRDGTANGRVFTMGVEVLRNALGPVQLYNMAAEALHSGNPATKAQTFMLAIEVLRSIANAVTDTGCSVSIIW